MTTALGISTAPAVPAHQPAHLTPLMAVTHCAFTDDDAHRLHLSVRRLHRRTAWVLREPNGCLRLETLATTPEGACSLALAAAGGPTGGSTDWPALLCRGYQIVHPVGPYFHPGQPSEYWGRGKRRGYWQTRGEAWPGPQPAGTPPTPGRAATHGGVGRKRATGESGSPDARHRPAGAPGIGGTR